MRGSVNFGRRRNAQQLAKRRAGAEYVRMLVGGLLFLAGLGLVLLGRRGRRTDKHPRCRACGYDLSGKAEESTRCSECGADLTALGAVTFSHRTHRKGLVRVGWVVFAVGLWFGGWRAYLWLAQVPWIQYEPLGWVLKDADSTTPAVSAPAQTELMRRLKGGELSASQAARLVDHILDIQADASRPWGKNWSDFILVAHEGGRLTDKQTERFVQQGITVQMNARPVVRRGGKVRARVTVVTPRFLPPGPFGSYCQMRGRYTGQVVLGGIVVHVPDVSDPTTRRQPRPPIPNWLSVSVPADEKLAALPDGPHDLTASFDFEVTMEAPFTGGPYKFTRQATAPVRLAASDATVDVFEVDAAQRAAMLAAVPEALLDVIDGKVAADIRLKALPRSIAMEVILSRGGKEQSLGLLQMGTGQSGWMSDCWHPLPPDHEPVFADGKVDVVLRPSQTAAESSVKLDRYWGEPIVLHDVPVRPEGPRFLIDESLRPSVEAALEPRLSWGEVRGKPVHVEIFVDVRLSTRLSYDVVLRGGQQEVVVGRLHSCATFLTPFRIPTGRAMAGYVADGPLPAPGLNQVDVILRPKPGTELYPASETLPWGGTIIFRDVPIWARR